MGIKIKKAQEEMVGFALIVIIVAIIILVFIGFSLREPERDAVESYEVESFIFSVLEYTTDCRDNFGTLSINSVIKDCNQRKMCLDGREVCEVLNSELGGLIQASWPVNSDGPIKGYEFIINADREELISFEKGNKTSNSKGSLQALPRDIRIFFTVYY